MRASKVHILTQIREGVEQILLPELHSVTARTLVDLMARLLNDLVAEETTLPRLAPELAAAEAGILDEATALLAEFGADADVIVAPAADAVPFGPLEAALSRAMTLCRQDVPAATRERALACFAGLVQAEWRFRAGMDPEVAMGRASLYGGGGLQRDDEEPANTPAAEPAVTAAKLQAYLRRRGGIWADATVEALDLLSGGFGKETHMVAVRHAGTVDDLVMRRDLPTGATGVSVVEEYPVLAAVYARGIDIPEPLWLEADRQVFGTPFVIVRRVAGSMDISAWKDDPARADSCMRDIARQLAALHGTAPPAEMVAGREQLSVRDWIGIEIDIYYRRFLARRVEPVPLLTAAYAWLRANIPASGISPRIVHGDCGFHNMLMADGRVTGIIDWEYAHPGDPQEDLNYVRPFIEMLGPWDRFVGYYEAAGGPAFRPQDARFWEVWMGVRNSSSCVGALKAFTVGNFANPDAALKLAVAGLNFGPRHMLYSVEKITAGPQPK